MGRIALLFLTFLATGAPQDPPQERKVFVEAAKVEVLNQIYRLEQEKDWDALFKYCSFVRSRHRAQVVPLNDEAGKSHWIGMREYLIRRFSRLPKAALEAYRAGADAAAEKAFEAARGRKSDDALYEAAEEYFFASGADRVVDELAAGAMKEGRTGRAMFLWNRLLRYAPHSSIPKTDVAIRLGAAYVAAKDAVALENLKAYATRAKIEDPEGRLRALEIPLHGPAPMPGKMPFARGPEDRRAENFDGIRNEIRRWTFFFGEVKPKPAKQMRVRSIFQTVSDEYPLFPAYARVEGKDYVVFTDGTRVVAIDPARVEGTSKEKGLYWSFPAEARIQPPRPRNTSARPYIGAAVADGRAYALTYSPSHPPSAINRRQPDLFVGVTAVKCLDLATGKLLWETDGESLLPELKKVCKGLYERNFSFTGRPVVRDGRIYLGVATSPYGERESRVVCLDAATGRPLWTSFLCSVPAVRNAWGWNAAREPVSQTLVVERGGVLYVQTNLGIVASLDGRTGDVLWLSEYPRVEFGRFGRGVQTWIRPAGWPVEWKGTLFVLPQNHEALLGFETATGRRIDLPEVRKRFGEFSWRSMIHLVGVTSDWMVLGGNQSQVLRLRDYQAYTLAASNTTRHGLGIIHDHLAYLSQSFPDRTQHPNGVVGIYDARASARSRGNPTWKNRAQTGWKEEGEGGNLLVAGEYLISASDRITVYASVETIRKQFAARLDQSPPDFRAHLEFGTLMMENGRTGEAIEAYTTFEKAAEGDETLKSQVAEVRSRLHGLHLKQGVQEQRRNRLEEALKSYKAARRYASGPDAAAEAEKRITGVEEKLRRRK